MKKSLAFLLSVASFSVLADPKFDSLSKKDVERVSKEFGANFSHTTVSAPSTDGLWGVEIGIVAGQTASPELKKVVASSGGDSKDFKNVYHAGVFARAHFPLEIFAEVAMLPEQEFSDVTIASRSFELGWNAGRFFNLPLDLALGVNQGTGEVSFKQNNPVPNTKVELDSKTTMAWVGASKQFFIVTPYVKVGTAKLDSDLKATGSIFGYTAATSENTKESSTYLAAGANFDIFFLKLGAEYSQVFDAKRISGKLSFSF
jgi:hypothetical protein